MSGRYACTAGYTVKVWDVTTGRPVMEPSFLERETKATALAFRPGRTAEREGTVVWIGTNQGELQELDVEARALARSRPGAHGRREVVKMHRFQNAVWSLDEDGRLLVWLPTSDGVPSLEKEPLAYRVAKGHTFSMVVKSHLWHVAGRDIRVYNPMGGDSNFHVTTSPLGQPNLASIGAGATIPNQLDKVFFGHTDGNVSVYSSTDFSCIGVFKVSDYKINTLAGAGSYLWAGFNTGAVAVYDTRARPWKLQKDWPAHERAVTAMAVNRSSVWTLGSLHVATVGQDQTVRFWDGLLADDWQAAYMQRRDADYCTVGDLSAVVVTWNAGAATPAQLRHDERDRNFFRDVVRPRDPPDLLAFGFQELVDLEDKRQMGKTLFKGSGAARRDAAEHEPMSRQYRDWRDYLVQLLDAEMPAGVAYDCVHTAHLVGLFSCLFVRSALRARCSPVAAAEVRRDKLRLGYKGALLARWRVDDSTLCWLNCHLAAGQTETRHRNEDAAAILDSAELPPLATPSSAAATDALVGGGDGRMPLDHALVLLSGDLNYRIDAMPRRAVLRAVEAGQLARLRARDQLAVSRRRYPDLRLRALAEAPLGFAPTYKYDVGADRYDTSDKGRAPAWCDRVLFRDGAGQGRVRVEEYRRWEMRLSDHRPVSASLVLRVRKVDPERRERVWRECEQEVEAMRRALGREAK